MIAHPHHQNSGFALHWAGSPPFELELVQKRTKRYDFSLNPALAQGPVADFGYLDVHFEDLDAHFEDLRVRFADLRADFEALRDRFADLDADFEALRGRFGDLRADFEGLRDRSGDHDVDFGVLDAGSEVAQAGALEPKADLSVVCCSALNFHKGFRIDCWEIVAVEDQWLEIDRLGLVIPAQLDEILTWRKDHTVEALHHQLSGSQIERVDAMFAGLVIAWAAAWGYGLH